MKFFLLIMIGSNLLVNAIAQELQTMDSVYFSEIQNYIQSKVGKKFVKFSKQSLSGDQYSEKKLLGRVTVINFWFEFCSPCIAEFDDLNKLYKKYRPIKKFQFFTFTTDAAKSAKRTAKKYNLKFPILCVSETECKQLNCQIGFPTTILIDPAGRISSINIGGSVEKEIVERNIKTMEFEINKLLEK